jgi:hypothetical protein
MEFQAVFAGAGVLLVVYRMFAVSFDKIGAFGPR